MRDQPDESVLTVGFIWQVSHGTIICHLAIDVREENHPRWITNHVQKLLNFKLFSLSIWGSSNMFYLCIFCMNKEENKQMFIMLNVTEKANFVFELSSYFSFEIVHS